MRHANDYTAGVIACVGSVGIVDNPSVAAVDQSPTRGGNSGNAIRDKNGWRSIRLADANITGKRGENPIVRVRNGRALQRGIAVLECEDGVMQAIKGAAFHFDDRLRIRADSGIRTSGATDAFNSILKSAAGHLD